MLSTDVTQLTLTLKMTYAQVVETLATVNSNSPIQDYVRPDDQTQPTFETYYCYHFFFHFSFFFSLIQSILFQVQAKVLPRAFLNGHTPAFRDRLLMLQLYFLYPR